VKQKEWRTLCDVSDGRVEVYALRDDGDYDLFRNSQPTKGRQYFVHGQPCGQVDSIPISAVPASMGKQRGNGMRRVIFRTRQEANAGCTTTIPTTFEEYVLSQAAHIQLIMEHSDQTNETAAKVAKHMYCAKQIVAGTDGGLLNGDGTFGYVWAQQDGTTLLAKGNGEVPGHPVSMSSTRTELCGLFAALTHVRLIIEYYHMALPREGIRITIYCDSKAALQRVQDLGYDGFGTTWRCRANYDIESAIRTCIRQQPGLHIKWTWVKGHASRRKRPENFSIAEQLNEAADALATIARDHPKQAEHVHWPEQHISLIGPSGRVSGRLVHELRYCCTAADIMSYWQQRYEWTAQQVRTIDIIGTAVVARSMKGTKARRIQKLRSGWLPVNNRESRSDPDRPPGCSACSASNLTPETVDHLFQCRATERRRAILDRFQSFYPKMREIKTASAIIRAVMTGSIAWIEGKPTPHVDTLLLPDNTMGQLIHKAYCEQEGLGWNVLFRGFWTTS
jgi:ribonuclease HI